MKNRKETHRASIKHCKVLCRSIIYVKLNILRQEQVEQEKILVEVSVLAIKKTPMTLTKQQALKS